MQILHHDVYWSDQFTDLFWCSAQQDAPPGQAQVVRKAEGNLKKSSGEASASAGAGDQRRAGSALMRGWLQATVHSASAASAMSAR
ncbi:MAG: hypothetical protein J0H24_04920, partial [Delftia acidovorans]|nr:hypothetical protein [Delftia acidovorans]